MSSFLRGPDKCTEDASGSSMFGLIAGCLVGLGAVFVLVMSGREMTRVAKEEEEFDENGVPVPKPIRFGPPTYVLVPVAFLSLMVLVLLYGHWRRCNLTEGVRKSVMVNGAFPIGLPLLAIVTSFASFTYLVVLWSKLGNVTDRVMDWGRNRKTEKSTDKEKDKEEEKP